ncbi:hypothetical protein LLEC1_06692 [Akanthomyces lecanii]|uniref:Heterokaryon incompatibility domain-containing protein n=1 Tax=Cordyceps confragosa TaxID=2714763 RepID=A0A179IL07_CORDF|nr:hypothetical protein LLEC1_06692 [Akanthomyces lecanii]
MNGLESARMRFVYENSHINLAASSSMSVHGGLFYPDPWSYGGFTADVLGSQGPEKRAFFHEYAYAVIVMKSPLSSRAWAFQERLLGPRTLYFGRHAVLWECNSEVKSNFEPQTFDALTDTGSTASEFQHWNWSTIVPRYSSAKLTHSSDRLPALSGVAARYSDTIKAEYLAGLWRTGDLTASTNMVLDVGGRPNLGTWIMDERFPGDQFVYSHFGSVDDAINRGQGRLIADGDRTCIQISRHSCIGIITEKLPVLLDCSDDALASMGDIAYLLPVYQGDTRTTFPSSQLVSGQRSDAFMQQQVVRGILLKSSNGIRGEFTRVGQFQCFCFMESIGNSIQYSEQPQYKTAMQLIDGEESVATAQTMCAYSAPSSDCTKIKCVISIV